MDRFWKAFFRPKKLQFDYTVCMVALAKPLNRDAVIQLLLPHKDEFANFHVSFLGLFGSVARNEASSESDVDLLVRFNRPVGLFHVIHLRKFLEKVLRHPVDLVLEDALRHEFREQVMKEMIRAA
jgi:predicted nucleotidyltransferase